MILKYCSGQFVFCPSSEDNQARQARDLIIGFHSGACKHRILDVEWKVKPFSNNKLSKIEELILWLIDSNQRAKLI